MIVGRMSVDANSTQVALPSVEIYMDGGCEPNSGPGGYGAVLLHPKKRAEASGSFRLTTNNRMEIYATIKDLENFCLSSRAAHPSMCAARK